MGDKASTSAADYNRRCYTVEGDVLEKARRIELIVKVDGKMLVQMEAREPGMLAFVSRPVDQGFDIEVVSATGRRYTDHAAPDGSPTKVSDWQAAALGLEP